MFDRPQAPGLSQLPTRELEAGQVTVWRITRWRVFPSVNYIILNLLLVIQLFPLEDQTIVSEGQMCTEKFLPVNVFTVTSIETFFTRSRGPLKSHSAMVRSLSIFLPA